ncbi:MAG TPA: lytic murein transglycosylase B [Stenotrophobium sp.]|jgi:membrane-bound lytic murein transglycosylase B|nr:lytic murein transglycosylase B [Stenotrophobium sp.]
MKKIALLLLLLPLAARADFSTRPQAARLLQTLGSDYGFDAAQLADVAQALHDARPLPQLVTQEQKAPERTENWTQYSRRLDDARIQGGVAVIRQYADSFARAEDRFGVPPQVIAAILGVETRYGRITGNIRVLDSLATQGFDHPTRSAFFFDELTQYFVFCRDFGFDPLSLRGSYAGAMGDAQFMPSNYRRLALDFDGDGHRDLWSLPDAIGSIANYFVNFRPQQSWRRGEPLAVRAHLTGKLSSKIHRNGHVTEYSVAELAAAGVVSDVALPAGTRVGLIELPTDTGTQYWLGLHNFYTVMTYNPRIFYAMAVTQLAQRIEQQQEAQAH